MATIKDEDLDSMINMDAISFTSKIDDTEMLIKLKSVLSDLRLMCPGKRSERSRYYAVTITEMEKVVAYFGTWIVSEGNK